MYIVTATPHRISFFGGGTDLPGFFSQSYGAVLSASINKFVYVTVKRHGVLFDEPYRLNYSETELTRSLDNMRNQIARETLRALDIDPPIYISTVADMPAGSGLGSSSSFAVGLSQALNFMKGRRMQPAELAELACHVEIDILKKPIGKQDQYSAAIGGLNHFRFQPNGHVAVTAVRMPFDTIEWLFDHFLLLWTGVMRSADAVLQEQRANMEINMPGLTAMRDAADAALHLFESRTFSVKEFGQLLSEGWAMKRGLAKSISNPQIDDAYNKAVSLGAYGGKICGAGAGGFLLLCVPPERKDAIRKELSSLKEMKIAYEPHGSHMIFPHGQMQHTYFRADELRQTEAAADAAA